jgi:enoyl-CoA hydratase/carnithine racemase
MTNMTHIPDPPSTPVLSISGACATVRLNRPSHHNRLEPADIEAILGICETIAAQSGVRVVLFTASGKSFCAGYHLGDLAARRASTTELPERMPLELLGDAVERLPQPTIAVLNGPVYGAGADLALSCDFRIGVEETRLRVPVATLGGAYSGPGLRRFATRLSLGAAKRIFLCGETFEAEALRQMGFLDVVVPASGLELEAAAWVGRLAAKAPIAVACMKRVLNDVALGEYDAELARENKRRTARSADYAEGVAAIAAKRPPIFRGE